jgi:predicted PurR-regulated permease PerM
MDDKQLKKVFASALVLFLILFLLYALMPYKTAVFGAIILYSLFRPLYKALSTKTPLGETLSALLVMLITLAVVIIPLIFVLNTAYAELRYVVSDYRPILELVRSTNLMGTLDDLIPGLSLSKIIMGEVAKIGELAGDLLFSTFQSIGAGLLNITLMYFLLYYMLTGEKDLKLRMCSFSPFNRANTLKLMREFKSITYTTIVVTGVIAIIQGTLLGLGFHIFGIKGAVLWGVIAALLSFLPIVGPPLIWIPVVLIKFLMGDVTTAVGFLIWGLFLSNVDNVIRPGLQRKIGNIHPLISIVGVFIGLPIFGIIGIIIGPLMLSYLVLMLKMYREEYMD